MIEAPEKIPDAKVESRCHWGAGTLVLADRYAAKAM
jgi:hypothetical protein